MRELKFRVWFENVKLGEKKGDEIVWRTKSYYDYDPVIDNHGLLDIEAGWDIQGHSDEKYVIEQYTGLKDKNGKEIYEGDIVEAPIYGVWTTGNSDAIFGDKIWKLLVIWSDADCGFLFKVIGSKNQPNRVYDILDQRLGAFEVIGNVHENAELLEEENEITQ